jgi:hypothetical protein
MRAFLERFRFRRWGKWIIIGAVGFVVFSAVSVEATSQSSFCNSCHIMEPYYSSWKLGSHKNVECVRCHIAPGADNFVQAKLNGLGQVVDDVLDRTSHKPSASVSQLSCTRSGCHSVERLSTTSTVGKYKFDHSKHLGAKHLGVEITCATCHSHVKGDAHFEVNTNVCITCHLVDGGPQETEKILGKENKIIYLNVRGSGPLDTGNHLNLAEGERAPPSACTTCHDPPKAEIEFRGIKFDHSQFLAFGARCEACHQGVTARPPPIEDGRCLECHNFGVEATREPREMHRIHTLGRHKIECESCHGSMRHGAKVQTASLERFDCTLCHIDQHRIQRDNYFNFAQSPHGGDASRPVSPMFLAHVDCTGCHTRKREFPEKPEAGAIVMAAEPASCDHCHQPGFGDKQIPVWQKSTHTLYDRVEAQLKEAEAAGVDAEALKPVRDLLTLVRADGSWGVHNPGYTKLLLEKAGEAAAAAIKARKGDKS